MTTLVKKLISPALLELDSEIFICNNNHRISLLLTAQEIKLNLLKAIFDAKLAECKDPEEQHSLNLIFEVIINEHNQLANLTTKIADLKYPHTAAKDLIAQYLTIELTPFLNKLIPAYKIDSDKLHIDTKKEFEETLIAQMFAGDTKKAALMFAASDIAYSDITFDNKRRLFIWDNIDQKLASADNTDITIAAYLDSSSPEHARTESAKQHLHFTVPEIIEDPEQKIIVKTERLPIAAEDTTTSSDETIPEWFKGLFIYPIGILGLTEDIKTAADGITDLDLCIVGTNPRQAATELKDKILAHVELQELAANNAEIRAILNLYNNSLDLIINDDTRAVFTKTVKANNLFNILNNSLKEEICAHYKTNEFIVASGGTLSNQLSTIENKIARTKKLAKIEILLAATYKKLIKQQELEYELASLEAIAALNETNENDQRVARTNIGNINIPAEKARIDAAAEDATLALDNLSTIEITPPDQPYKIALQNALKDLDKLNQKIAAVDAALQNTKAQRLEKPLPVEPQKQATTTKPEPTRKVTTLLPTAPAPIPTAPAPIPTAPKKPTKVDYKNHNNVLIAVRAVAVLSGLAGLLTAGLVWFKLIILPVILPLVLTTVLLSITVSATFYFLSVGIINFVRVMIENRISKKNTAAYNKGLATSKIVTTTSAESSTTNKQQQEEAKQETTAEANKIKTPPAINPKAKTAPNAPNGTKPSVAPTALEKDIIDFKGKIALTYCLSQSGLLSEKLSELLLDHKENVAVIEHEEAQASALITDNPEFIRLMRRSSAMRRQQEAMQKQQQDVAARADIVPVGPKVDTDRAKDQQKAKEEPKKPQNTAVASASASENADPKSGPSEDPKRKESVGRLRASAAAAAAERRLKQQEQPQEPPPSVQANETAEVAHDQQVSIRELCALAWDKRQKEAGIVRVQQELFTEEDSGRKIIATEENTACKELDKQNRRLIAMRRLEALNKRRI